jgi:glucose-6-phosphate isomerase
MSENINKYLGETPFTLPFDLKTGLSDVAYSTKRSLSQMKGMFNNEAALEKTVKAGDPLVYEFYELGIKEHPGDLAFGTSILYPGKVGNEYFMTKGHFHTILDTAEVYYCLSGHGYMLMENPEGDWKAEELLPGKALYVSERYAHRSINVGSEPLVTFFVFRSDAGHNYGTIETMGYRKLIVEQDGKPVVIDNPRWKQEGNK